jgi:hypothetical protein
MYSTEARKRKNYTKYRLTGHELKDKKKQKMRWVGGWVVGGGVEFIKGGGKKVLRKGLQR